MEISGQTVVDIERDLKLKCKCEKIQINWIFWLKSVYFIP